MPRGIMDRTVTRFAPSPTGLLHLGHVHSALFASAAAGDGCFLLRIEDIDPGRCRPEFEAAILEDLAWLGLSWEGPVRRQSDHLDDCRAAVGRLEAMGVLYPCFCTRREMREEIARMGGAPQGPDGPIYPGTCRDLPPAEREARLARGDSHALRLDVGKALDMTGPLAWIDREAGRQQAKPELLGDVALSRKDAPASYHLAVTVDDHLQGVTLVTRGLDLFPSTHIHRLLQALLGYAMPEYWHHQLIEDETGQRLAKRADSKSIRAYRDHGLSPAEVRWLAGWDGLQP